MPEPGDHEKSPTPQTEKPSREESPVERRQKVWRGWIDEEFQRRDEGKLTEDELKDRLAEKFRITDDELTKQMQIAQSRAELLNTDELSEIPNGYMFDRDIDELVLNNEKFGLIMMDIDNFRAINSAHGHSGADKIIRQLARTLEAALRSKDEEDEERPKDKVYRLHGDEEAILIRGIEQPADLMAVSERLRTIVEQTPARLETGEVVPVTMSFGGAIYDGSDLETFIDTVDKKALYGAKENGKNNSYIIGISDLPKAA